MKLHKNDNSRLFREDATFYAVPGLADASLVSFRSFNYPTHYIRHRNNEVWIDEPSNDNLYRQDATFRVVSPWSPSSRPSDPDAERLANAQVPAPVLVSPGNGHAVDYKLGALWSFAWQPVPGAVDYQLMVEDGNKNLISNKWTKNQTSYTVTIDRLIPKAQLMPSDKYEGYYVAGWWVRAKMQDGSWSKWSPPHVLWLTLIEPPPAPRLATPHEGAQLTNYRVGTTGGSRLWKFDWHDVPGASLYQLQVGNIKDRTRFTALYDRASEKDFDYLAYLNGSRLLPLDELDGWYWKVQARVNGEWSPWSRERNFTVAAPEEEPPPPPPALLQPQANSQLSNGRADGSQNMRWTFDWQDVPGADSYQIQVANRSASNPLVDQETRQSDYVFVGSGHVASSRLNNWAWRVRAKVRGTWGPWSQSRPFSVQPAQQAAPPPPPPPAQTVIRFENSGAYVAKYRLVYFVNGSRQEWNSGKMAAGQSKVVTLPAGAANITAVGWASTVTSWKQIFGERANSAGARSCYKTTGTVFSPGWGRCG